MKFLVLLVDGVIGVILWCGKKCVNSQHANLFESVCTTTCMGRKLKKMIFWFSRRSHLPVILIGGLVVLVLFFNDETSMQLNLKYQRQINELNREIKLNRDSAAYYRGKREAILQGADQLERIAREQYHLQRPTEDVYLLVEK